MTRRTFITPLLFAALFFSLFPVSDAAADETANRIANKTANNGKATAAVRKASEKMAALLRKPAKSEAQEKQLASKVADELRGFLDIDELGRLALTDHWSSLSSAQRAEYQKLLRGLIEASYIRGLRANLKYKVTYDGQRIEKDRTIVSTRVHAKRRGRNAVIEVDYLLRLEKKTWRAVDVITDGVGLVENYRAQFNRIIGKEGVAGLLKRMKKRLSASS